MPADIHVTKIVFKSFDGEKISYIQFFYSNGSESPAFETITGKEEEKEHIIVLDEVNRPVRKVKGTNSVDKPHIGDLSFINASGVEVD